MHSESTRSELHGPPHSDSKPVDGRVSKQTVDGAPLTRSSPIGLIVGAIALVVITGGSVWFLAARRAAGFASESTVRTSATSKGTVIRTTVAVSSPSIRMVDLLGEARPFATVTLYAKVAGYLKTITVDVGDRVRAGDVLATIESPETDRALTGAKADYDNKQVTSTRIAQLLGRKLVSPQEADQARTEAAMASERLEMLREQQGYEALRAPFAGKVTARFADAGALVQSAATSQTSALPVVTVSQTDRLRVLAYLDQSDATNARAGTPATITLTERPDVRIPARISRVSGELDPKTRKMLAELDIENHDDEIVPGSFVQVHINFPAAPLPEAPVEALLVRGGKTFVGTIDDHARVHIKPVVVQGNDGRAVTFVSGVSVGDRIALSLGGAIVDGDRVQLDSTVVKR